MKKLIIYTSKTGTTEKCVNKIANKLKDVTIINLEKDTINIDKYDMIIIGSPIRMGKINKKIKKFIKDNLKILLNKRVAYFICCCFNENWKQYYEQNIPKKLLDNAFYYTTFGGEMNLEKQKGLSKIIVKIVNKNIDKNKKIELINKNIDNFIKKINI